MLCTAPYTPTNHPIAYYLQNSSFYIETTYRRSLKTQLQELDWEPELLRSVQLHHPRSCSSWSPDTSSGESCWSLEPHPGTQHFRSWCCWT